jgi:hypothetical protein
MEILLLSLLILILVGMIKQQSKKVNVNRKMEALLKFM